MRIYLTWKGQHHRHHHQAADEMKQKKKTATSRCCSRVAKLAHPRWQNCKASWAMVRCDLPRPSPNAALTSKFKHCMLPSEHVLIPSSPSGKHDDMRLVILPARPTTSTPRRSIPILRMKCTCAFADAVREANHSRTRRLGRP